MPLPLNVAVCVAFATTTVGDFQSANANVSKHFLFATGSVHELVVRVAGVSAQEARARSRAPLPRA